MKIQESHDDRGNRWWSVSGMFHREDGPSIIYNDGEESWYYYNKLYKPNDMPLNLFLAYVKWELKKHEQRM